MAMNVIPKNTESIFNVNELFFSMTDLKGIIQTGNSVFVRVSQFTKEELIGQPHNIIRHPDMPRCVFKVLWAYIQSGKNIIAYVKNMSKDGSFYWVLACVYPMKGRYLSIRLKPTTAYLSAVEGIYKELIEIERKSDMDASLTRLLEFLKQNGFSDFDSFMSSVLVAEIKSYHALVRGDSRMETKNTSNWSKMFQMADLRGHLTTMQKSSEEMRQMYRNVIDQIEDFGQLSQKLSQKSQFILDLAEEIRLLSLNASVESNRMKDMGRTLGVVANEMKENAQETSVKIHEINEKIEIVIAGLQKVIFEFGGSNIQIEMMSFFITESLKRVYSDTGTLSSEDIKEMKSNINSLFEVLSKSSENTLTGVNFLAIDLSHLIVRIRQLETIIRGAELIHINGIIETAKIVQAKGFSVIFNRAIKLIKRGKIELEEFRNLVLGIRDQINAIQGIDRAVSLEVSTVDSVLKEISAA